MQHLAVCFQRKLLRQHGPVLRQEVPDRVNVCASCHRRAYDWQCHDRTWGENAGRKSYLVSLFAVSRS
ncbi:hypothetical protein QC762_0018230 [Podospora pseudocomata]|uniref:Uncharacterized protein n=1 Tax=Podospora pseudocomata TaxID=2093779 RepID=A0ABR0GX80_9PEZI|nr:hypothetical protein QC762_0018230 [Podospora pseudocomata]